MRSTESGSTTDDATVQVGAAASHAAAAPGAAIGRYLVIDEVGAGGMGIVLRAYDPKLQREVALKRVRTGSVDARASARIVREARAMAKLAHPNVVTVFDVDLEDDGIVLAMEFVDGVTLREWLADPRPWRDVVRAFVSAGHGLVAAHAVGLLHRDFKPANVLVGRDGRVRVTDFGLARPSNAQTGSEGSPSWDDEPLGYDVSGSSIDQSLESLASQLTMAGVVEGTPQYMAPEQHQGDELTPATDQYAFCVALWEALAGALPFRGRGLHLLAAKRAGPPAWPKSSAVPRGIAAAIRRGLAPNAGGRWPTMEALLVALARATQRPKRLWMLGGVALLGAAAGAAWLGYAARPRPCQGSEEQMQRVWDGPRRERVGAALLATGTGYAGDTAERVLVQLDDYVVAWSEQHREACEATALRREQSADVLDLRMACLRRAAVDLGSAIDLLAGADAEIVKNAQRIVDGLPALPTCADVEALEAEVPAPDDATAAAVEAARERMGRAHALEDGGKYRDAKADLLALLDDTRDIEYAPLQVEIAVALASVLEDTGDYDDAIARLEAALPEALRLQQWDAATRAAGLLGTLVGHRRARVGEGLAYMKMAIGLSQRAGVSAERRAWVLTVLGSVLKTKGDWIEAERAHRQALELRIAVHGPMHADVARSRGNLGNALFALDRRAETELELRKTAEILAATLGPSHPDVAMAHNNLAVVLQEDGRYADAEREFGEAIAILDVALGSDHPDAWLARANRAVAVRQLGRAEDSERQLRAALDGLERGLGADHPYVSASRNNLGGTLRVLGRWAEAEALYRQVLASWEATLGPQHSDVAVVLLNLARCARQRGASEEARAWASRAQAIRESAFGPEDGRLVEVFALLAEVEAADEHESAAREHLQRALSICNVDPHRTSECTEVRSALERLR